MDGAQRSGPADQLQRMVDAHTVLHEVSRTIGPATDLASTVANVLAAMHQLVEFRGGSVCLVEDGLIRMVASDPPASAEVLAARVPVGGGLAGRVVTSRDLVYSPDLDADDRVDPQLRRLGSNAGMCSWLGVPLICLSEVIGLIQVDSAERDAFDAVDRTLLMGLGALVANAIESARQFDVRARLEAQKRAFIEMVGHELRTPLTIAAGFVEGLLAGGPIPQDELQLYLRRTRGALARLGALVEELIVMSQVDGADLKARLEPTPVAPMLERITEHCSNPDKVILHCPADLVVDTDERLVALALEAVLDNALKYGGDAEITATETAIAVQDHGPGLPEDIIGREFERFSRSATNNTTIAGLGLGLAMASTLAGLVGGALGITSSPGQGTVVTLELRSAAAA